MGGSAAVSNHNEDANLREAKLPFDVAIRHNAHGGNRGESSALEAFVKRLAAESGNRLSFVPALVQASATADARDTHVETLSGAEETAIAISQEAGRFEAGRGHYCHAQSLFSAVIDNRGLVYKCWEDTGKPQASFGTARDWNPADPFATAEKPDELTKYLNTAAPIPDAECRACIWLPLCIGGCPRRRLAGNRACVPFKDDVEGFVLAVADRMVAQKEPAVPGR